MESKKIELTIEEVNGIISMLHIAVKTEGLNVAEFCASMQKKLKDSFTMEAPEVEE
jgi:hypothetical protein